ncbi:Ig-like domain-containing protein [Nitrosopumilus sp.]|uniref:Ig-like domain-containing protein n=1 Tax=Nitrosopumilus sp. TaxID=2024843 RepID=UPI00247C9724|nr:Ig-like domain-containing protein [Nitrosopumilus sp.]MCV0409542.1 Ig-like domain-containing protein [Nitrosopumilus sp.]
MKSILFGVSLLLTFSVIGYAYAIENEYELEYNLLPNKIHENDIVTLEVYNTHGSKVSLDKIRDLKVESLDKSIIEVIDFEKIHPYKTLIKLKAYDEGETILYVFTEGSTLLEIPVKVYGNNLPKNISLDLFPDVFEIDQNNQGILSLLLTDENGMVTRADKDYLIKLGASKSGVITFSDSTAIISKGEFETMQTFTVNKKGLITITAKSDDLESSKLLTVDESADREIQIFIIPEDISSSNTSSGHLIAQLFSNGKLIKATKDITVFYEIESSTDSETVNTSSDVNTINPNGYFQIKKGQTYGHELFSIQKGETDSYTLTATTQDPLVIVEETFETIDVELYGHEQIKFEPLSVLSDGSRQLIGVLYLEDENGHPVTADRDIVVPFTTSDKTISIENSIIKRGFESALVFGNMGYFVPANSNIAPNIPNSEVVTLDIDGFDEDSVSLKTYVSTDHFLKGERHWIAVYMESSDGLFQIPNYLQIDISDSDIFAVDKENIMKYPYFTIIPIMAVNSGDDDLVINAGEFETSISLSSVSSKPDSLSLDYSDRLFNGVKDTFVLQILDSSGFPVKINEDINVKIFSSDSSILDFPKSVTIPKKSSFTLFDLEPASSGTFDVSFVSEGLPILTEEIVVEEITPTIQITSADIVEEGDSFIVSILAKQNGVPLQNAPVIWELEGGITTISDEQTGPTGEAIASIISTSDESVKILASIDGPIQSAFASKIIKVNATSIEMIQESDDSFKKPDVAGFDPILIMVPAVIVGMIFYMKRKSK